MLKKKKIHKNVLCRTVYIEVHVERTYHILIGKPKTKKLDTTNHRPPTLQTRVLRTSLYMPLLEPKGSVSGYEEHFKQSFFGYFDRKP